LPLLFKVTLPTSGYNMYLCCPKDLLAEWQIHTSTSRWTRSCSTAGSIPLSLKGKTIIFISV
jgi:hypothetical protein